MDVFISYRRDTGSNLAALIETRLNKLGVGCFLMQVISTMKILLRR